MFGWLRRRFSHEPPQELRFDAVGLRWEPSDGDTQSLRWDELTAVRIITNDHGPWREDVFFILEAPDDRGWMLPHQWVQQDLLSLLAALPGFDHAELARAMGSTSWNEFVCWRAD